MDENNKKTESDQARKRKQRNLIIKKNGVLQGVKIAIPENKVYVKNFYQEDKIVEKKD
jgi:hypothetical protein